MIQHAISLYSVVPIRAEASETAEQTTQMLFAQTCRILQRQDRWLFIELDDDKQQGWADRKMITPLSSNEYKEIAAALKQSTAQIAMPMTYAIAQASQQTIPLTASTRLPNYNNGQFHLLGVTFSIDPQMVITSYHSLTQESLMSVLRFFLNTPYLWGGKNAMGMDCSGFVQVVMSLFDKKLPRNASEQATKGRPVRSLKQATAGDLAFFSHDPQDKRITHVGILFDNKRIVHCSGRVKVEAIDEEGIISAEQNNTYTHHLLFIKHI